MDTMLVVGAAFALVALLALAWAGRRQGRGSEGSAWFEGGSGGGDGHCDGGSDGGGCDGGDGGD